ncbi:MAG TPA: lipid-A-disaccharide synthase [Gemmatimonadaceae bacterium]
MREILIVAGEASGDLHASAVAASIRALRPEIPLTGIGGDRMREAGVELIEHADRLAVMGFVEVLKHIPQHARLLRRLRRRLAAGTVGLVILVDYPGFNMRVAAAAKRAGVPVLYFITPQVWAWHASRLTKLSRLVTKAAPILPFEEALLREHGIDATFVGHPLLDRVGELPDRDEARRSLGLAPDARVLALFPGSRAQEIERHLDDFVATARELQRRIPGLEVRVSVAPTVTLDPARCPFPMVRSASYTVFRAADAALCKSGTTTLEAAVAGCPLVIAYRTNAVTYALARRLVTIPHIGLVNVVAGRGVAREFVQDALQPSAVADALEPLLDPASAERAAMLAALDDVRRTLGEPGAAGRVARLALDLHR